MRYNIQELEKFSNRIEAMKEDEMQISWDSRQQSDGTYSWFDCPKCDEVSVPLRSNFCPECGQKLKW